MWSLNQNVYMGCLWSAKGTNVHASPVFLRVCAAHDTRTHASIMSLWSLQSNSLRQKSLKQPWFWSSCNSPSVSSPLNSHQPLLLPKITQERHSNPSLTTAQLGHKRGIKTHTKKETHHIVEKGEKSVHTAPCLKISTDDFGNQRTTHTYAAAKTGERKVCLWMYSLCPCVHTSWMRTIVIAKQLHWHLFLFS